MDDLRATRDLLSRQLAEAVATDPIGALPVIVGLQKEADEVLRIAVREASSTASWSAIAEGLGVSKQAAHQRFKAYAKGVGEELKVEHRAMRAARRTGDADGAAAARARRGALVEELREAARAVRAAR